MSNNKNHTFSQGDPAIKKEIEELAEQIIKSNHGQRESFIDWLYNAFTIARDKDILIIHSPGGWGNTSMDYLLKWERSIVDGVSNEVDLMGYQWALTQYFRSGNSWWRHVRDMVKEALFFMNGKSSRVDVLAAALKFLVTRLDKLTIILVGASQGAAFGNAVMQRLGDMPQCYSIELGIFFPYMSLRMLTERTLAIDSNGTRSDPMCNRNLRAGFIAYMGAFYRWFKYRAQGKPKKFSHCINVPGHEYGWDYPEVKERITDFLVTNFKPQK